MGIEPLQSATILIVFAVAFATDSHADIYKHVDRNGRITYSNKAISGADKLPANPSNSTKNRNPSKTNNHYPVVNSNTQAKRDLKRRQILENELATEKKLLFNAKQSLINAQKNAKVLKINNKKSSEKLIQTSKEIKNRKLLHERNITALRKELAY